jgi:hypothetical protein
MRASRAGRSGLAVGGYSEFGPFTKMPARPPCGPAHPITEAKPSQWITQIGKAESAALFDRLDTNLAEIAEIRRQLDEAGEPMPEHVRQVLKDALFPVLTAVIPVPLPLREVVPELAYLHREERVHSKIQPVPYDLCTHSEQEP